MAKSKSTYKEFLSQSKTINDSGKGKSLSYSKRQKIASKLASQYNDGKITKAEANKKLKAAFGIKPKQTLYQKFSKEFTAFNASLDKTKQLPLSTRRGIIKKLISEKFEGQSPYKVSKSSIFNALQKEYRKEIKAEKNAPNLLLVEFEVYALVNWFDIDDLFANVLPKGVFGKVSAGEYGNTEIFNTQFYSSTTTGIDRIIENVREASNNTSNLVFAGEIDVRPDRKNDGKPDSYYLHMVLFINEEPTTPMRDSAVKLPTQKIKSTQTKRKVNNEIERKIKELKKVKDSKKRARNFVKKNIQILDNIAKKSTLSRDELIAAMEIGEKTISAIDRYKKSGKISKKYAKVSDKLMKSAFYKISKSKSKPKRKK